MAGSLTGRLLLLTMLTVVVMEVLILAPSIARYRADYLTERLRLAQIASLAILAAPEGALDATLERELLDRAGAASVVLRRDGARALVLSAIMPKAIDATYDMRAPPFATLLYDAARVTLDPTERHVRVIGLPYDDSLDEVEITMDEAPLRKAMLRQGRRILNTSLAISLTTAALIYLLVRQLLVGPMRRLTSNMSHFAANPEDPTRIVRPTSRVSEIAVAERALAELQTQVLESLRERARLAALGAAVAKISHDLRNMLSSAQLAADRIETSRDPVIQRVGPKLIGALGRAIRLCETTLAFGKAEEAPPEPQRVALRALVHEVGEQVFPEGPAAGGARFENLAPEDAAVQADPEHLNRILANLARNAREAIAASGRAGVVRVSARVEGATVAIDVEDDGPGLPAKALENLFQPFKGAARPGGFGLGLAIAQELATMQGGRIDLVRSGAEGTLFRVTMPAAP